MEVSRNCCPVITETPQDPYELTSKRFKKHRCCSAALCNVFGTKEPTGEFVCSVCQGWICTEKCIHSQYREAPKKYRCQQCAREVRESVLTHSTTPGTQEQAPK
jgi:hypothetical protein